MSRKITKIYKNCEICNKRFFTYPFFIKKGQGKFCSKECANIWQKGKPAPKTAFKKGNIPWNKDKKCPQFMGENHPNWKGGKKRHTLGYILVYAPDHPHKLKDNYILEHRLVIEKNLNRFLNKEEIVHHINGIKDDNRFENLELKNRKSHFFIHH